MKNKLLSSKVYSRLISKLYGYIILLIFAAAIAVIVLRMAVQGRAADAITNYICWLRRVDWETGCQMYQYYIRRNMEYIIIVAAVVIFLLLFRIFLFLLTRYFDQIVSAIDNLAEEADEPIHMCPELEFAKTRLDEAKSKLKSREKALREAEQRKNDLVVYLAHDIKTPLTSVIGYLNLLSEKQELPASTSKVYIQIALSKAYRLEGLINEFFEITRYNLASEPLRRQYINLCCMMVQISDEMYPMMVKSKKEVILNIPEDVELYGEPEKMARVFQNILKNAAAYGEENTAVNVMAKKQGTDIVICFENQGTIPQDKLDIIFEKFYRMDDARATATGGAGLGLAIARDIVLLHGGKIEASSNKGRTLFTVTMPYI